MKKHFSMLIALAMILTSLVPSFTASAAFSDVDDSNSYVEAISTLSTLQVINGYEDGSFQPEKEITRAEYTKMIVYMLGMDSFTTPITTFTDVPESHWANAYIKTAFDMGIINGFDDGTFRPDAPVTYEQALKMLVCTLGYEAYAEVAGGYPNGYRSQAEDLDLTDIVTGVGYESNAPRAVIAQIMFNGLEVPMKGMINGKLEDTGKTLINDYLGAVNLKGTLVGVANSTTSDCPVTLYPSQMAVKNSQTQDIVVIDFSQSEVTQAELVAKLGRSISVLYRKDRVSTDKWLVGLNNDTQKGAEITVNSTDIISFDGSTLKYRDNEGANATLRVDSSNVTVQYNGRAINFETIYPAIGKKFNLSDFLSPSGTNFMYGTARFVSNDSSSTYNMVDIYDYEVMVALRAVNSSDYTVIDKIDSTKTLPLKPNVNEFSLTKNGSEIEPTSISANDVVLYAKTLDGSFTTVKVSNKSVSGSVESLNSSKKTIKINGTDYNYTDYFNSYMTAKENGLPTPGQSIKAYTDDFGTIQWGTVTSSEKYYQYSYIVKSIPDENGNGYYLKVFAPSSRTATSLTSSTPYKVQTFKVAESVKLNGSKVSDASLITALESTAEAGSTDLNQFIRISTNSSNEIDNVITVTDTGKENTDSSKLVKYAPRDTYTVTSTALKLGNTTKHSLKSSTPLFVIPHNRADVDNYAVKASISSNSLKDGISYSLESYDLNTSKYPAFLAYYPAQGVELSSGVPITIETNFSVVTDDIGEEVIDSEVAKMISTYTTATDLSKKRLSDKFSSSVAKGDFVLFGYDSDGYVNTEKICIDYSNDIQPILTAADTESDWSKIFNWSNISGTGAVSGYKKTTYAMYNVLQTVESENKLYVSPTLYESEGVFNTNYEVLNITSSTKIVRYDKDEDEFTPYAVGTDTLLTINDILDAELFGTGCSKIAVGAFHNTSSSSPPTIEFIVIYD